VGAGTGDRGDVVRLIKETADIVAVIGEHVSLKRAGVNLKGLCPFHSEKTPSFVVNPQRQTYHCFGCGEGGDVFSFLMNYHRMTFPEALKELAKRYNIALPERTLSPEERARSQAKERLFAANEKAATFFHQLLLHDPAGEVARRYLRQRAIDDALAQRFRLGFAPKSWDALARHLKKNGISEKTAAEAGLLVAKERGGYYDRFRDRVLFPILDPVGRVVGFGGRILGEGEPKYLNTPETPVYDKSRLLFGLYQNRDAIRKARSCFLVEGNFDLLSLVQHGVENVVAPLGTALTNHQVRLLRNYVDEVVLLFDGDEAGAKAALRAAPLFLQHQLSARVAVLPPGHDPDSYVREHGRDAVLELAGNAQPLTDFIFGFLAERHGLSIEGKEKIIAELAPVIHSLEGQLALSGRVVAHFSERLGVSQEQFLSSLSSRPGPRTTTGTLEEKKAWQLHPNEERLFGFLFMHGAYLQPFLEAGLAEAITTEGGRHLLHWLTGPEGEELLRQPEQLLDRVAPEARPLVSKLLVESAVLIPEDADEAAQERISWLKLNQRKKRADLLVREINAAYRTNDTERLLELMEEKKQLDASGGRFGRGTTNLLTSEWGKTP